MKLDNISYSVADIIILVKFININWNKCQIYLNNMIIMMKTILISCFDEIIVHKFRSYIKVKIAAVR